jgi:hypothetical protein
LISVRGVTDHKLIWREPDKKLYYTKSNYKNTNPVIPPISPFSYFLNYLGMQAGPGKGFARKP